ncbi:MAG: GNAT family N-acetyltransferase [Anaerolineae bacterium]
MIDTTVSNSQSILNRFYLTIPRPHIVAAAASDIDEVVALFGALHSYNASLDQHFALAEEWESLLRAEFAATCQQSDKLWLLVKDGDKAVGLLIAAIHTDSPMFKHRQWVEVEALYVASSHRNQGLAHTLLNRVYS